MVADSNRVVFFFDYDNTLFPTSIAVSETPIPEQDRIELENKFTETINLAKKFGLVYIITNSEDGWVKMSAKAHMPGILSTLEQVPVISAKSSYEELSDDPIMWKYHAMDSIIKNILCCPMFGYRDTSWENHVVSIGDSSHEREALFRIGKKYKDITTKSVKFMDSPTVLQLIKQLNILTNSLMFISNHSGKLDLMMNMELV